MNTINFGLFKLLFLKGTYLNPQPFELWKDISDGMWKCVIGRYELQVCFFNNPNFKRI